MKYNDTMPKMKVDPENYRVEADGVHMTCEAAESLPLSQASYVYWEDISEEGMPFLHLWVAEFAGESIASSHFQNDSLLQTQYC